MGVNLEHVQKSSVNLQRLAGGNINIWVDNKPLILDAKPIEALTAYFQHFGRISVDAHEFIMNCEDVASLSGVLLKLPRGGN